MLITGELRDLRNNKRSRDLTAVSLQIPVSGVKQCFECCDFIVYVVELGLNTRYSKVTASLVPLLILLAETTIT